MPSLKLLNLSIAVLNRFCCWYITLRCDLDLWSLTSNICSVYRLWRDESLYQIWTQSRNPWRSYCNFNIWPNDLECRLTVWDNFHKVSSSSSRCSTAASAVRCRCSRSWARIHAVCRPMLSSRPWLINLIRVACVVRLYGAAPFVVTLRTCYGAL